MQRLVGSKSMTTIALIAGAAALSVLGSAPAGAQTTHPRPGAPAGQAAPAAPTAPDAAPDAAAAPQVAAASVDGQVVSNVPLYIRASATTDSAALGSYAPGAIVHLKCKVNGQTVDGNPRWYKLSDRTGWVAARYVLNLGVVPWC